MQVLNIFHVLIAIALVAFVLIQRGQGATAGAAFGSGASGTVFGARGAGNFLSRTTWVLAGLFCAISLTMAVLVSRYTAAPETDLGVVSAAQEVSVPQDSVQVEPSVVSDEPLVTDIPQLDTQSQSMTAPGDTDSENATADETLPAIEAEGETEPDDGIE